MEKLHLILNDPAQHLKIPQPPKKLLVSLLTANQASRLFKQPDLNTFNGYRDRTILEILYSCAPRILELRQLKETDVDLRTKSLRIYGKGNKTRIVPIGQNALSFLTVYLEEVRPLLLKEKTELLFVNRFGQEFGTSGMLKKIKNYAKSARIKKNITVHTFRHTLATEMLRKGCELSYIQRILGHESLTTTQQYTHIVKDELKKVQSTYHPREALELPQGSIKYEGLDQ
jgi:integrase/recombinase XerD